MLKNFINLLKTYAKDLLFIFSLIVFVLVIGLSGLTETTTTTEEKNTTKEITLYERECKVIYTEKNIVTVVTLDGNEWEFLVDNVDVDRIAIGKILVVSFDTHGDKDIFNDSIVGYKEKTTQ